MKIKNNKSNDTTYNNRWLVLGVLISLPFMSNIDTSIVNIALPTIRESLQINMFKSSWIVSSYLVSISAFILIFGRLGDLIGKDKVFLKGFAVFTFGSFICGISPTISILIVSRIIQGIGASMLMANNQGLIAEIFPENERGRALGISSSCVAVGAIFGPPLGGFIITYLSWHYIFLINIPIGILALIVGYKTLPSKKVICEETLDKKSVVLLSTSIILFFSGLLMSQSLGFKNIFILLLIISGIGLLLTYIKKDFNSNKPLIDFSLFKNMSFSINLYCAFIYSFIINSINIILPFYFADGLSLTPKEMSTIMLVNPILMFITAPIAGALSDKIGSKKITIFGLSLLLITLFSMTYLGLSTSKVTLITTLIIFGIGSGAFHCSNTNLIMSCAPDNKLGLAGSCNALTRNIGYTSGTCVSTSLLYYFMSSKAGYKVVDSASENPDVFIYAMRCVFIILTVIVGLTLCLSLFELYYHNHKEDI